MGALPLSSNLSFKAKNSYILDGLQNSSLLSIGQLCDDDCTVIFDKKNLHVLKNTKFNLSSHERKLNGSFSNADLILHGQRNTTDGLWDVSMSSNPTPSSTSLHLNAIIRKDKTKTDLATYLHACAFSPTIPTFHQAIKNKNFITWPSIEQINFEKFVDDKTAIYMGHMDQVRQNLQPTKLQSPSSDYRPSDNPTKVKSFETISQIVAFTPKEFAYGDLTGAFPFKSSRGNKYLYLVYDYDSNAILVHPLKSRQAAEIRNAWEVLYAKLTQHGHTIKNFILDNEFSNELKRAFNKHNINHQFVPPHMHRANAAERAIRTFKSHFLAGLASCDPLFPIGEWDRLLEQAELTLNLLRTSRCNPHLSAHAYINGIHDFNKEPLAPPGTKVIIHQKPQIRKSWGYHGKVGWYVGPAKNHYRCYRVFVPETATEIITDTLKFLPHKIPFPTMSINDHMKVAIDNIVTLLSSKIGTTTPSAKQNKQLALREAFIHISKLLKTDECSNTQLHQHLAPQPRVLQRVHSKVSAPRVLQQVPRVLLPSAIFSRQFAQPKQNPNIQPIPPQLRLSKHNAPFHLNHIYDKDGQKINIDKLITTEKTKTVWLRGLDNELGRLAQGFAPNNIRGTNTVSFIDKHKIPVGKKITYVNFVCDLRPLKKEMYRVRMTVGGDKLDYPHDTASPTAALLDTKLIINSTISDHKKFGSKFCSIDIKDFFLQTIMEDPEFLRIHKKYFSPQFIAQYQLSGLINKDGYVYGQINKGMYGLKQAAILAYKQLVSRLKHHGYVPITATNGLWKHITKPTLFALCVDDFGVKYNSMDDLNHLKAALQQHYEITVDMEGKHFCGLSLEWNYDTGYVDVSMPNYVARKLKNSNIINLHVHSMHHTNGLNLYMVENYNTHHLLTPLIFWIKKELPEYNPSMDRFYITVVQLTQQF